VESLEPKKKQPLEKFHYQFLGNFEHHLDNLTQILLALDEHLPTQVYEGTVIGVSKDSDDDSPLMVKSQSFEEMQAMCNHREAGQELYPLEPGEQILFFRNIYQDMRITYVHGQENGTLFEVMKRYALLK
jgi:hypothetical protein